jgi:hypothetical protein
MVSKFYFILFFPGKRMSSKLSFSYVEMFETLLMFSTFRLKEWGTTDISTDKILMELVDLFFVMIVDSLIVDQNLNFPLGNAHLAIQEHA